MDALTEWQKQDEKMGPPPVDPNVATVQRESYQVPGLGSNYDPEQQSRTKNLRGHHFQFGSHAATTESNMKATFKHPGPPLPETSGTEDQRVAKTEELRQANFTLGSDKNPEQYVSVHTAEISGPARIKPLPLAKINSTAFREHNVVLGTDRPLYSTRTEETYVDHGMQNVISVTERDAKRAQMRLASFTFGSHQQTYASTSRDSFNEQPMHGELCAEQSAREVGEKVSVMLGHDLQERRSEAKDAFGREEALKDQCSKRQPRDPQKKKELNAAHFALGHDATDYGTTKSESFTSPKRIEVTEGQSAREKTLMMRRSNVSLGCDNVPKVTSARTSYQPPPDDCEAFLPMSEKRKGYLDGVHFEHGHDNEQLRAERKKPFSHHVSETGLRNANYSQLTALGNQLNAKQLVAQNKITSVAFGHEPFVKTTTHTDGYQSNPGYQRIFVSDEHRRALRCSNFSFGNDNVFNKDLCTVHGECFSLQKPSAAPGDGEVYTAHGKANNVLLGAHAINYGTEHKDAYVDPAVASPPSKKGKPVYTGHEDVTSEQQKQFRWPERPRLSAAGFKVLAA